MIYLSHSMVFYIISSIAAVTGAVLSFRHQGVFHKIISWGLFGSFISVWLIPGMGIPICIGVLLLMALLTTQYALLMWNIGIPERISIATLGLAFIIAFIFRIQHWSGALALHYVLMAPVLLYLYCLFRRRSIHTKEFSFMLVWMVLSLYELAVLFSLIWYRQMLPTTHLSHTL